MLAEALIVLVLIALVGALVLAPHLSRARTLVRLADSELEAAPLEPAVPASDRVGERL